MDLGPHAVFIWTSYAAVALGIALLFVWIVLDGRKQTTALKELEARGVRRRSADRGNDDTP